MYTQIEEKESESESYKRQKYEIKKEKVHQKTSWQATMISLVEKAKTASCAQLNIAVMLNRIETHFWNENILKIKWHGLIYALRHS